MSEGCGRKIGEFDCCVVVEGDCMKSLPIPVNLLMTDPPYGVTALRWDTPFDLSAWWRLARQSSPCSVVFCQQPFASRLTTENLAQFRYNWIWRKQKPTNFLQARKQPLRAHEEIFVFSENAPPYFPQGLIPTNIKSGRKNKAARGVYQQVPGQDYVQKEGNFPRSVLDFDTDTSNPHPTAKPIDLCCYLTSTYTLVGETVLDPFCGAGAVLIAAKRLGRHFLGIEIEPKYVAIARERLAAEPWKAERV